jgi:integration host factor subunit beta
MVEEVPNKVEGGFMTKADLVDHMTALGDLTRRDGEVIVETLFDSIIDALKSNDKVEVRGFGSFRSRQRKPRTGRNPKTGESVAVPAKRVPYFKPSKELRDLVNPGEVRGAHKNGAGGKTGEGHVVVDPHHPPAM